MTQQTDAAALDGKTLSQNYFYNADVNASGAGITNGAVNYTGTVQATGEAAISGTIHNTGNGFFSVTAADGTLTNYQIVGSTADGQNLIFENAQSVGSNSGPHYVLSNSGTIPSGPLDYNSNNSYTAPTPACFIEGTLILTPSGEIPIEKLRVGDLVTTSSGETVCIKWLGHRQIDCERHPFRDQIQPIRIDACAIATGTPKRDLLVSPHHAIAVSHGVEFIVPAMRLVNGSTIGPVEFSKIDYWHIELDHHDLIIANGIASETYQDVGNRGEFDNNTDLHVLYPKFTSDASEHDCRERVVSGNILTAIRKEIELRAVTIGWTKSEVPNDVRILVDNVDVPYSAIKEGIQFTIPLGAGSVSIVSNTFQPCSEGADSIDARSLGCYVGTVTLTDSLGKVSIVEMDDPRIIRGFHESEQNELGAFRWTNGRGELPKDLWSRVNGNVRCGVRLTAHPIVTWSMAGCASSYELRSSM